VGKKKHVVTVENSESGVLDELFDVFLVLKNREEISAFMKDLCTPQELHVLAERWRVCRVLARGTLSYRDIHALTGASLVTIGRVARFLRMEQHRGYQMVLERMKKT
jgi:TrpR-related protein YerC/YecD